MTQPCSDFRARLSALLSGRAAAPEWTTLAWHEHLHTCAECRDLLEAEEALEVLLETLPEPRLPRALCERVLERLATARPGLAGAAGDAGLDQLLGLAEVTPPDDLAGNVLRGLRDPRRAAREERALDDLLERVPAVETPDGLTERVLAGLDQHRERRPVLRPVSRSAWGSAPARWAAAAVVLVPLAFGLWRTSTRSEAEDRVLLELAQGGRETAQTTDITEVVFTEPSDELLASLDLLESWEFLTGDDVDQVLASLDTLDELGLYLDEEGLGG